MDQLRTPSNIGEENIPDDLRCKRSDGKQWRCTALSMPDKTVCEKHYVQAKKRAANSAMRASLKKSKREFMDDFDIDMESKSDDMDDSPLTGYPVSVSEKYKEKVSNRQFGYSPETPLARNPSQVDDDLQRDIADYEENPSSYKTPPATDSLKNRSPKRYDDSASMETSGGSSDSSDDKGGKTCHQCHRNDRDRVFWCLRCDRRGYCDECISTWYSNISLEEIQRICPACRGICNCKTCLRGDNLIKVKIRDIPAQEKLEHLYCLLSSVLPVIKQIHFEQFSEVVLERRLRGNEIDLARTKLNADEQMCCDFCRIPIIDYHRHCSNCSFDICLNCCQDLRGSTGGIESAVKSQIARRSCDMGTQERVKPSRPTPDLSDKLSDWKANSDGSIPCPPKEYGGCGYSSLILKRIFKMNWLAKLVKNVEEMVSGCKVYDDETLQKNKFSTRLCQYAHRENSDDNFLYCPSSQVIKDEGIREFRKHWIKGEPVIVREVCDVSSMLGWDPMVMWRGIQETTEEKLKDDNRTVKAIDFLDRSEIDITLGEFIKGYAEGRIHEDGWPEMLKLKNWPSPSASEEFLLYQRPEFIGKLPLLEYIHSKWGLLNVAAKLPHYSLQNDVGPKIVISYGMNEELGRGDSVNNLHTNMRDVAYLLVHTCEVNVKGLKRLKFEQIQTDSEEAEVKMLPTDSRIFLSEGGSPKPSFTKHNGWEASLDSNKDDRRKDQDICATTSIFEEKTVNCKSFEKTSEDTFKKSSPGALWDVFRRQDIPKLIEYMKLHSEEFGISDSIINDSVPRSLYDGIVFLNNHHKRKLKEEFSIEPWSFEQHLGEAIFIPTGCPFQLRNLQSTVQLGLDFLSPESLGEAVRLAEEIRGLPNDHESKLQMLEVGKISLYAASSAIKEVQKLVLDPKLGPDLGFEDPNLTSLVSQNLEKMTKHKQITCA